MAIKPATFTLAYAIDVLKEHHLLREIVHGRRWTLDASDLPGANEPVGSITYDTRKVDPGSMLFVKGRFKPEFLDGIDGKGLAAYVAETEYADRTKAIGIIVELSLIHI